MDSSRGKILVIRGGAIGDFILTLPAIAALRRRFPGVHLEVLGYPHIVQLAVAGGLVDRVQSIEAQALAGFFARQGALDQDLTDYFSEFDVIVSYLYDPDQIFQVNIGRCSPAQFIAGPHRPDETEPVPAARVFLKPLERLAIFDADPLPRLVLSAPAPAGAGLPQLALHPGSGSEKKNWPEERWAELLQHLLLKTTWHLFLIGGEAEGERLQRLAAALPPARARVAQSVPLAELAYRLKQCTAFVGHDSGIAHLAAALGLPGLVLWGESVQEIWQPPHPDVVVVKGKGGTPTIRMEDVIRSLTLLLQAHSGRRPGR